MAVFTFEDQEARRICSPTEQLPLTIETEKATSCVSFTKAVSYGLVKDGLIDVELKAAMYVQSLFDAVLGLKGVL